MDTKDYLNTLKTIELRPKKTKIKEFKPQILNEQENKGMSGIHAKIIKWFMKNPAPSDNDVHKFSEEMGIDTHKFEGHIYMILGDILTEGRSKEFTGSYDSKQIKVGTKVEMEHTTIPLIAEKIVKDHLAEIPDYYTRLKKMESEAGVSNYEKE